MRTDCKLCVLFVTINVHHNEDMDQMREAVAGSALLLALIHWEIQQNHPCFYSFVGERESERPIVVFMIWKNCHTVVPFQRVNGFQKRLIFLKISRSGEPLNRTIERTVKRNPKYRFDFLARTQLPPLLPTRAPLNHPILSRPWVVSAQLAVAKQSVIIESMTSHTPFLPSPLHTFHRPC